VIESAFVFDKQGRVIRFHLPHGRTGGSIPDSRDLWALMMKHRDILGGVAHTHPGKGYPNPSCTDVTTFSACELGLGVRLLWPIATVNSLSLWVWEGPDIYSYIPVLGVPPGFTRGALENIKAGINHLRKLSGMGGFNSSSRGKTRRTKGGRKWQTK